MNTRHALRICSIFCGIAIIFLAVKFLVGELRSISIGDFERALDNVSRQQLGAAVALTIGSFVALGTYDILAAREIAPGKVSLGLAWLAGAAGNAVSNTLGFHAITSTAVRYRIYRVAGLELPETVRIMSLSWMALGTGFVTTFSLALIFGGTSPIEKLSGTGLIGGLAILINWLGPDGRQLRIGRISLRLPAGPSAARQMALGAIEMAAAIGALYVLLPTVTTMPFVVFSAAYIGAVLLGIASHAPGGIGVFEATMLSLLGQDNRSGTLAALLLYRLIYNFAPFFAALIALCGFEYLTRRKVSLTKDSVG